MRAIGLDYERKRLERRTAADPSAPGPGEVLFRVLEAGVCGTDRDLAHFKFGYPPAGESFLTLGHEAVGEVLATGAGVTGIQAGDIVVPSVRRACPGCASCDSGRRDLCLTLNYTERGIMGAHGYFCDYAIDQEQDLFRVPRALADVAVLIEPLGVCEKAADVALEHHRGESRTALVLGAGPIGILSALVLAGRGLNVTVLSLEDPASARAALVRRTGAEYTNSADAEYDIVIEAAGNARAATAGFDALAPLGVFVVLGAPSLTGDAPFRRLILRNQVLIGSVNASPAAWQRAVTDLGRFDRELLKQMIHRVHFDDFEHSILGPPIERPKTVHVVYNS